MFQELTSLVIDIGTHTSKVGYGGNEAPSLNCPSYISQLQGMAGEQAHTKYYSQKSLHIPSADKEITSIFRHRSLDKYQIDQSVYGPFLKHLLVDELKVPTSSYSFLFSEDIIPRGQQANAIRQYIAQYVFEELNAPNLFFIKAPVLACFATGRSTSTIIDTGDTFSRVVVVHNGFCLQKSARIYEIGGKNINQRIKKTVVNQYGLQSFRRKTDQYNGPLLASFDDYHQGVILRDIKHSLSSVRSGQDQGHTDQKQVQYQLPDHNVVKMSTSSINDGFVRGHFQSVRCYSHNNLPQTNTAFRGLAGPITEIINSCDIDIRKQLYSNLLYVGGNSLYHRLIQTTTERVVQNSPPNAKVKNVAVTAPWERQYLSWIGGSIVANLSAFQSYWVGKGEWKEHGVAIFDKKCAS